jgi:hypothetical protein
VWPGPKAKVIVKSSSGSHPFLGGVTHFENEKFATHLEYPNNCFKYLMKNLCDISLKSWGLELFGNTLEETGKNKLVCRDTQFAKHYDQFHQNFMSSFCADFLEPEKFKSKLQVPKSCFRSKILLVKCWWNWHASGL